MKTCPVCNNTEKKKLGEKNGFTIFLCRNCRSVYAEEISGAETPHDYSEYYHEGNLSAPEFVHKILGDVVRDFEPYRQSGRLLDIGCGAGAILDEARKKDWQAEGLEVSAPAVERLRQRGFEIFRGTLAEAAYPDDHFDVVTAIEVVEHVDNVSDFLREIARILRPQGLLWLTTPHANGISSRAMGADWSIICPPEHVHLFSIKGLKTLLEVEGFADYRFVTGGFNPFEIIAFYCGQKPDSKQSVETSASEPAFDRVSTGYRLNEWLLKNSVTSKMKDVLNSTLDLARLGDNLKVWATLKK